MRTLHVVLIAVMAALSVTVVAVYAQPITVTVAPFDGNKTTVTATTLFGLEQTLEAGPNVGEGNTSDEDCNDDLDAGLSAFGDFHSSCTPANE